MIVKPHVANDLKLNLVRPKRDMKESRDRKENGHRKHELCKYYLAGTCLKGERCFYMHKTYPCKYYHISKNSCRKTNVSSFKNLF